MAGQYGTTPWLTAQKLTALAIAPCSGFSPYPKKTQECLACSVCSKAGRKVDASAGMALLCVGLSSQDNWGQPIARIAIALAGYFAIPVPSFANLPD